MTNPQAPYVLGAAAEQERLIRQAAIFDPLTERLFVTRALALASACSTSAQASAMLRCWRRE